MLVDQARAHIEHTYRRPLLDRLRDEMGIAGGVKNLQWLFTATFVVMLAAVADERTIR